VGASVDSGADFGWEASGSLNYIMPSGWTVGIGISGGEMAYDATLASTVDNSFVAVRPTISYLMANDTEVFLRAEYIDSDLYDLAGASVGFKILFD
ncbi:hypothetical protein HA397_28060, partial [Escherichia coli]|nr:hypothetical protein [Escherichia coli]